VARVSFGAISTYTVRPYCLIMKWNIKQTPVFQLKWIFDSNIRNMLLGLGTVPLVGLGTVSLL